MLSKFCKNLESIKENNKRHPQENTLTHLL